MPGYQPFYKSNFAHRLFDKNVVYIAYIGKIGRKDHFKYGTSTDVYQREYTAHRKTFSKFEMLYIRETNFKDSVEMQLERELKLRRIHAKHEFNGKMQTELFFKNKHYDYDFVKAMVDDMIDVAELQYDKHLEIRKEELKLKQLELELKLLMIKNT
jgi:hypothetical protein